MWIDDRQTANDNRDRLTCIETWLTCIIPYQTLPKNRIINPRTGDNELWSNTWSWKLFVVYPESIHKISFPLYFWSLICCNCKDWIISFSSNASKLTYPYLVSISFCIYSRLTTLTKDQGIQNSFVCLFHWDMLGASYVQNTPNVNLFEMRT